MSSDEIFAAQMWPWPDPLLKRDPQGRILFVNAAFLRIYGGQVQDWHGNSVAGWPAPMGGTVPNRFETRLATPEGELVYDWVEYTLADGGTLGLGRDVTELLPAPQPDPAHQATPPHVDMPPAYQEQAPAAAMPVHVPAMAAASAAPDVSYSPEHSAPAQGMADQNIAQQDVQVPDFEVPTFEAETIDAPNVDIPEYVPEQVAVPEYEVPQYEAAQEIAQAPVQEPAHQTAQAPVQAPVQEPALEQVQPASAPIEAEAPQANAAPLTPTDRDYERRALPIENDASVLGTNWRDAVIAKAVGNVLPASEAEAPSAPEAPAPTNSASDGPLRILLAEDNAINALLTRTLLEADGCDVDVVEDGALAVEAMKNQSYDMIFMDMRMPNMDGLESTRKIRALPNVPKSLPIVALTANAFDDDRNACFDSGMNDFMTKPVSAEELSDMVNQWARKEAEVAA